MIKQKDYVTITLTEKMKDFFVFAEKENLVIHKISLSDFTTFGVGGTAEHAVFPANENQLDKIIGFAKKTELPFFVLGHGSNILASDDGYSGLLVVLRNNFAQIDFRGETITASAGAPTCQIARLAFEKNLSGAEFLTLLPATIGGAAVMNAGCFGYSLSNTVKEIYATCGNGIEKFSAAMCRFGYRKSVFQDNGYTVCRVALKLKQGSKSDIEALTNAMRAKKTAQPLGERTAGSVFLNESEPAAKLIERCGLKGFSLGGAAISEKHANFIVNRANATEKDISNLIAAVKNAVYEKTGILLRTEIKFLGD